MADWKLIRSSVTASIKRSATRMKNRLGRIRRWLARKGKASGRWTWRMLVKAPARFIWNWLVRKFNHHFRSDEPVDLPLLPGQRRDLTPMGHVTWLDFFTWSLPAGSLALPGLILGGDARWGFAWGMVLIWTVLLWALGGFVGKQSCYWVIEQFGQYKVVLLGGWLKWRNPFFDKIVDSGSMKAKQHVLYQDDATKHKAQLEFTDASAPINASLWYAIVNPEHLERCWWRTARRAVALFYYRYESPFVRIDNIIDANLRWRLQQLSIDDAGKEPGKRACDAAMVGAEPALAELGVYPSTTHDPLVVDDIALPPSVIAIREAALTGKANAARSRAENVGPAEAMRAIVDASKDAAGNPTVTFGEARELVLQQMALQALRETPGHVNLFGSNLLEIARGLTGK